MTWSHRDFITAPDDLVDRIRFHMSEQVDAQRAQQPDFDVPSKNLDED